MKKDSKFLKTLKSNMVCTIVMIVALVLFVYFTQGDIIAGLFTSVMAVIVCACAYILFKEYKSMPASVAPKATAKKTVTRKKKSK